MSKKIILFLSDYKKDASSFEYSCPDNSIVSGIQSNDAPVKYLLKVHPDVTEIICLVTKQAEETAWTPFTQMVDAIDETIKLTKIAFSGAEPNEFVQSSMSKIVSKIQAGDEILLETTGGFRNAVMYLLLINRTLTYIGVKLIGAVYSNFQSKTIEELSQLMGLFDLVSGMQELSAFGAVETVRSYYEQADKKDKKILCLCNAVDELMETISLCRTNLINEKMEAFNQAMNEAENCSDVLFRQLIPVFRIKFGEELNILSLIKWCINSGMIQQALTIYTERIPAYIIDSGLLVVADSVEQPPTKEYEDKNATMFLNGFLKLSINSNDEQIVGTFNRIRIYIKNNQAEIWRIKDKKSKSISKEYSDLQLAVNNLIIVLRCAYKDGGYNPQWTNELKKNEKHLSVLKEWTNKCRPKETSGLCKQFATAPDEIYLALLEKNENEVISKKANPFIFTIEYLEKLLPDSGFSTTCSIEEMCDISRDYLFVKVMRNMTNHANEEEIGEQKELLGYLKNNGYNVSKTPTLSEIKKYVMEGIERLEKL